MNVKLQKWDAVVAIYILTAFIMLIVPLPAWILDVFMAFNMAVAFTILFAAMFSKEVLDMSFFPTILLFTTIFRIAAHKLYPTHRYGRQRGYDLRPVRRRR